MEHYGFCQFSYNCVYQHPTGPDGKPVFELPTKKAQIKYVNAVPFEQIKNFKRPEQPTPEKVHKEKFTPTGKLFLAPMCTVGVLPFRRWCKDFGCDVTCSEMLFARDLVKAQAGEMSKLRRHPSEDVFGIQITGRQNELAQAAEIIAETCNCDYIELNAACPQDVAIERRCGY
jgi:tRNA-dihydrouridine synthase 3